MKKHTENNFEIPVEQHRPAYGSAELRIRASAERVFDILADVNNWPRWQEAVQEAQLDGKFEAGNPFTWKAKGMRLHSRLHTVKAHEFIGWTGRMSWIRAIHNWHIQPEGDTCLVRVEESFSGFLSGLFKNTLQSGLTQSLHELKAAAEAGLSDSGNR